MANPRFVSVNLTAEGRDELRLLTARLTVDAGRRVSMGDVATALAKVGQRHMDEVTEEIRQIIARGSES